MSRVNEGRATRLGFTPRSVSAGEMGMLRSVALATSLAGSLSVRAAGGWARARLAQPRPRASRHILGSFIDRNKLFFFMLDLKKRKGSQKRRWEGFGFAKTGSINFDKARGPCQS
jgi:hypothetical protein